MAKMSNKLKLLACCLVVVAAFAAGRWAAPEKVRTETKIVEVEKKTSKKDEHRETTTTDVVKPDGTHTSTTTVVEDNHEGTTSDTSLTEVDKKEVTRGTSKVTISALAGIRPFDLTTPPVYGASITKPILGPLAVGAFFLTNGTVGASIGLTF